MYIEKVDQFNCSKYPNVSIGTWLLIMNGAQVFSGTLEECVSEMLRLLGKQNPSLLLDKMDKATTRPHGAQAGTGRPGNWEVCITDGKYKHVLALGTKEQCEEVLNELKCRSYRQCEQNEVFGDSSYDDNNIDIGWER